MAYATASGHVAYDGIVPGNPFATAFIEAVQDRGTTVDEFFRRTRRRTMEITKNAQCPEWTSRPRKVFLGDEHERRSALVLIFSNYRSLNLLRGAKVDADRISRALRSRGFLVDPALDCSYAQALDKLASFTHESREADVALLYCTGHGLEVGRRQFVLPVDFGPLKDVSMLASALSWKTIARAPCGQRVSVAIWAGCRDNPMDWRLPARFRASFPKI